MVLLKSYDEPVTQYSGAFSEEALTQWALGNCEPVLTEMDQCAPTLMNCSDRPTSGSERTSLVLWVLAKRGSVATKRSGLRVP